MVQKVLQNPETVKLFERLAIGLFSILTTISLSIAGWTLNKAWESKQDLTVLQTKQMAIIEQVNSNKADVQTLKMECIRFSGNQTIIEKRMERIESDISEIKADLKVLIKNK